MLPFLFESKYEQGEVNSMKVLCANEVPMVRARSKESIRIVVLTCWYADCRLHSSQVLYQDSFSFIAEQLRVGHHEDCF